MAVWNVRSVPTSGATSDPRGENVETESFLAHIKLSELETSVAPMHMPRGCAVPYTKLVSQHAERNRELPESSGSGGQYALHLHPATPPIPLS